MTTPSIELRVDVVLLHIRSNTLTILLSALQNPQVEARWRLPGAVVAPDESLDETALRVMRNLSGLQEAYIEQLYTYGEPDRDPCRRSVCCAYMALLPANFNIPTTQLEGASIRGFPVNSTPPLAFDHQEILDYALLRLRYKLEYTAVGFQLLPKEFTLTELQKAYEVILGEPLDKRNFRRRILSAEVIEPTTRFKRGEGRPARLFQYRPDAVAEVRARRLFP